MDTTTGRRRIPLIALAALGLACTGDAADDDPVVDDIPPADVVEVDQTAYGFDDLDMDGDSELDADEFHEWTEGPLVTVYAPVAPGAVTRNDVVGPLDTETVIDGLYGLWDEDDDGALDRAEWARATTVASRMVDTSDVWVEFDMDGSATLDLAEVRSVIESDLVVDAMDRDSDGTVTDYEMNQWFFALFDEDENGALSRGEWQAAELYLGTPTF